MRCRSSWRAPAAPAAPSSGPPTPRAITPPRTCIARRISRRRSTPRWASTTPRSCTPTPGARCNWSATAGSSRNCLSRVTAPADNHGSHPSTPAPPCRRVPRAWPPRTLLPLLAALTLPGLAAVPTLDHVHPVAAQLGATNRIAAIGKFDPWPARAWTDDPGLRFIATTNKGEFAVEVDAGVAEGPHQVRIFNDEGASRPRCFLVERGPQTREVEP